MSTPQKSSPTLPDATGLDSATRRWLQDSGWMPLTVEPLAGDVSPRRYYRIRSEPGSAILATYPEEILDACSRFALISELLSSSGVAVPRILAADVSAGRMLLEDLGTETLYDRRDRGWAYLGPRIEYAADLLPLIAGLGAERIAAVNPPLDVGLFKQELESTWSLAFGGPCLSDHGLPPALESALETLVGRLGEARQTPCHRDFMARNLIPADAPGGEATVSVIDFQDLRIGPHAYDLASLLNDSLFAPAEIEERLLSRACDSHEQRFDYHRCAAQRGLKIVGTYLAFAARGAPRHLHLVEPSLERARRHLRALPELKPVRTSIDDLANALARRARLAGPTK